jgi:lipid II:glycine glycyltransferase (peptidoglycan interpeptide bridge formation enzyme)
LHQFGYERRERGTFVIDLRLPLDEIWASFKGNVRTAIRKCEKQQISIHTDLKGERLPEYQTILEEDRKRSSTRVLSVKQKFMHRDYIQGPNSEWRLYYALYEDRMVAGMIVFSFNGNAVHTGLCRSDFCRQKKLEAYYGIMWEIIKDGKKQGWARYDLAGVNPNPASRHERGIYSFKEKWGGKFIGYAEYSKVFRPRLERVISFVTRALKSEQ